LFDFVIADVSYESYGTLVLEWGGPRHHSFSLRQTWFLDVERQDPGAFHRAHASATHGGVAENNDLSFEVKFDGFRAEAISTRIFLPSAGAFA
jgi:hypothetical protein